MSNRFIFPVLAITSLCSVAQNPAAAPARQQPGATAPAGAEKLAAPKLPEAFLKAREAAEKGDMAAAVKILTGEAEKGNVEAMTAVAEFYVAGRGVEQSAETGVKWLTKAADAGHPPAQTTLAMLFFNGAQGVKKDEERARFLLQQAAEAGYAPAQFQSGAIAEAAVDTKVREPNWKDSRFWYEKAAAQGNPDALLAMVRYHDQGLGGPSDAAKATESCLAAAKAGNVVAMNEMGVRYQRGTGIRADNVAAIGWFTVATQYGLATAFINLGNCYETGNGVRQDFSRAGEYYAAAAKGGNPVAQMLIGRFFEEGLGTPVNPAYAYVNYTRAAAGGLQDAAKKRDEIKAKLTPAQLKEAEDILSGAAAKAAATSGANPADAGKKTDPKKVDPKKK